MTYDYLVDTDINYTTLNNAFIWSDSDDRFTDLPSYLNGIKVAEISSNRLKLEEKIGLLVHEPSMIYLVHERSIVDKLNETLIKDGWRRLSSKDALFARRETTTWRHGTEDDNTILKLPAKIIYSILFRGNNRFIIHFVTYHVYQKNLLNKIQD